MTIVIKDKGKRRLEFSPQRLRNKINGFRKGLGVDDETFNNFLNSTIAQIESYPEITAIDINNAIMQNAADYILDFKDSDDNMEFHKLGNTDFQYISARTLLNSLYKRASKNRSYDAAQKYGDYLGLLMTLGEEGLIDPELFVSYSHDEIREFGEYLKPERDLLLSYASVHGLSNRYLIKTGDGSVYELPQERYMTMAMALMRLEKENRTQHVKDLYDILSKHQVTMATPIYKNAGRPDAQLSSCFISTPEDDLRSIYDDNTDLAQISKWGGGVGTYLGFLRGTGASIRGIEGVSHGLGGWAKQLNNTSINVDQLGLG